MKTKRKIFMTVVAVSVLFVSLAHAQRIYFCADLGYGLPAATNNLFYDYSSSSSPLGGSIEKYERVKGAGSFGKGIQAGAAFGYMFSENIGAELGIGYLIGSKIKVNEKETGGSYTGDYNHKFSGKMIRIVPAVKITTGGNGNLKAYMRTGVVVGVGTKVENTFKDVETQMFPGGINTTTTYEGEVEFSGGTSLGFSGAVGVDLKVNELLAIFAEFGIVTQSWSPKKSKITKATENGVDQLPSLNVSDIETEFVDSYSYDSSTPEDPNAPSKDLKFDVPFSSAGVNVGVKISLGGDNN